MWFRDLRIGFWGPKSSNWKHSLNFVRQGCFSFIIISKLQRPIVSSNFHRFVILCIMLRYTNWEAYSIWQLTIVSGVFKAKNKKPRSVLLPFSYQNFVSQNYSITSQIPSFNHVKFDKCPVFVFSNGLD